jgi:hypothetical protein
MEMKKNKMMRLASGMLVLTLLTTCIISGTFAKYTTSDSGSDTARVAKWGVTALVSGSLFGENYFPNSTENTGNEISATAQHSVDASGTGNIVAPGTKNTTGLTLAVTGTPEVANTVAVSKTGDLSDIYLKANTYATLVKTTKVTADNYKEYYYLDNGTYKKPASDYTYTGKESWYEAHDSVALSEDYYPITWTLTQSGENGTTTTCTNVNNLYAVVEGVFNTASDSQNNANVSIAKTYTITWEWPYYKDATSDGADTILGNIIASAADQVVVKTTDSGSTYSTLADTDYSTNIAFNATITVTQVD